MVTMCIFLPSCITAYKTYINIDLKYFAGNNSPYKIIEKYRFRGFATILNNDEKIAYVEYIIKKNIRNYNINRVMRILGFRHIHDTKFYNITNTSNIPNNLNILNIYNLEDLYKIYLNIYGNDKINTIKFILENSYNISYKGLINYYKDYIIKLIYDKF